MPTRALISALLLAAVAVVYLPVRDHEFVSFDDYSYVVENPNFEGGFTVDALVRAFTTSYYVNWHPLSSISLHADYALHGADAGAFLITNAALHAASSVLLFLALLHMTGSKGRSAFVAAVFAVHPLHVESVAWVSERKDVLSGLFFALTLYGYAFYADRPGRGRFAVVLVCGTLGRFGRCLRSLS